jgi:phenylalanyl-tRNA synthetase beta chain
MIVSVNWLKKFTQIDMPVDELAVLIGARLVEIENVIDLGSKYKDVVVARVMECTPLEGSDHLNVAKLDDGGVAVDIERDERGLVQVVCGAPNVRQGLMVAWLPPKATVPQTANDAEPFVLGARKLRGVMSNGMIASARELDLYDEHEGILEVDGSIAAGVKFADAYELDDYLLDIENKSLTHRPDCFGIIGFAREVAAIQGKTFHAPEWLAQLQPDFEDKQGDVVTPSITVDATLSDRYQVVVLSGADATVQSPLHIQTYLARVGVRPINAVVDVTNYLMMLTGQPLHAFDYDKLVAAGGGNADIRVRTGRNDEKLTLLDGRTIKLSNEDIVIAAGETPIGLAGAMGGANTEIDADTKNIIIESATFNLYNLRATQMRHGIFSEAITRFTKGQPAELTAPVLAEAVRLMGKFAGAKRVSDVAEAFPNTPNTPRLRITAQDVNSVLGSEFTLEAIATTLRNVEFNVTVDGEILIIEAPYWRADIHINEDIIEEVGRLNGFDEITPSLPKRDFTAVSPLAFDELRSRIRAALARAGANEVLTYSFVHGDVLRKAGQNPDESYRIINSISPDLQYYRQSITPNLLGLVHANSKAGYDQFALFELNKTHAKDAELVDGVPPELHRVGLVVTSKKPLQGAPYYQAKRIVEYLGKTLGLTLAYKPFTGDATLKVAKPFELKRSARIIDEVSNQAIGIVGEYKKSVAKAFKLPEYTAGFELLTEGIELALRQHGMMYAPISRYPSTERDICFQVNRSVSYQQISDVVRGVLANVPLETEMSPVDIYQPNEGDTKNVTVRIKYTSHDATLTGDEVAHVTDMVTAAVIKQTGGLVL